MTIAILADCALTAAAKPLDADVGGARAVVIVLDRAGPDQFAACRARIAAFRQQGLPTAEVHLTNIYVDGGRAPHPPNGQLGADIFVCGLGEEGLSAALEGLEGMA